MLQEQMRIKAGNGFTDSKREDAYVEDSVYVLIRDDTEDALGRIRELKALGCQPFAQPYRDFEHEGKPSREQWRLAYWCNRKPLFYSVDYEEYRKNRT